MVKRELQFVDGTSQKFWTIVLKGTAHTVTFGRIGTSGQTRTKSFDTRTEATKSYDGLIEKKLEKGYVDTKKKPATAKPGAKKAAVRKTEKTPTRRTAGKKKTAKKSADFWRPLNKRDREDRPRVTPKLIRAREETLGIRFPASLLKLLRRQNGGQLHDPEFVVGGGTYYLDAIPPIREAGGIDSLSSDYSDHLKLAKGKLSKPELIIPLCGDGHCFIALDYRTVGADTDPEVIYLDIEGRTSVRKIAGSFDDFLAGHQTGDQRLAVRFDEIAPETIIATSDIETTHRRGKETAIVYSARLCLTEEQVVLYAYEKWSGPKSPSGETWERSSLDLVALDPKRLRVDKSDPTCHFAKPRATLTAYANRKRGSVNVGGVHGMTSERIGTNRWKNLPFGPVNYFKLVAADVALLEKCQKLILKVRRKALSKG